MTTPYEEPTSETNSTPVPELFSAGQLQAMVEQALAKERAASQAQIDALKSTVQTLSASISGTTPTFIQEHGGGVGSKIHETWSQFEQAALIAARDTPAIVKLAEELLAIV